MKSALKNTVIHQVRKKELGLIFNIIGNKIFENGLELGAGDGFQSSILKKKIKKLTCTELNWDRLKKDDKDINYLHCDAEQIDSYLRNKKFDFIFSSNLFEHLPKPKKTLEKIYKLLDNDGITVHVMPNPLWKISMMLLHYPITYSSMTRKLCKRIIFGKKKSQTDAIDQIGNNINYQTKEKNLIHRILVPEVHGAYKNNIEELLKYRKSRWKKMFIATGYKVKIIKGPFFFGYFNRTLKIIATFLDTFGLCSEYIYIAKKDPMTIKATKESMKII